MKITIFLDFHRIIVDNEIFEMRLVDEQELKKLRLSGKPVLIYKEDKSLWIIQLERNSEITNEIVSAFKAKFSHCCFSEKTCCKYLSALPDPHGCPFIRDRDIQILLRDSNSLIAYSSGMRIEKYDRITHALQYFSIKGQTDWVKILDCSNFEASNENDKKQISALRKHELVVGLANNLYPQIEDYEHLKEFLKKKDKLV